MIQKFNGFLPLPNGEPIECDIEIDVEPTPLDEDFMETVQHIHEKLCKVFEISLQVVGTLDGTHYSPTGPVVEGTLAEKCEEDRCEQLSIIPFQSSSS